MSRRFADAAKIRGFDNDRRMPEAGDIAMASRRGGLHYGAIDEPRRAEIQKFFGIPFNFTFTGGVGLTYSATYTISTSFNFMWELTGLYKSDSRDFTVNIRDEYTSEDMFVSPLYASLITGTGQNQSIMPRPYIFFGGTTINVTAIDVLGGAASTIQLAFIGYKFKDARK